MVGRRSGGELERLCARKAMGFADVVRVRQLMEASVSSSKKRRPHDALILKNFVKREDWQISVEAGETVTVLDKLEDGWWLVDKSCGRARGPFGCVPGLACCWTAVQPAEHDGVVPVVSPTASSATEEDTKKKEAAFILETKTPTTTPMPQRGTRRHGGPPPLPPRTVSPEPEPASPPPLPAREVFSPADLREAFAYVARLVNGDGFTAVPPDNFNALCRNPDFADKVRRHVDYLRKRRSSRDLTDAA